MSKVKIMVNGINYEKDVSPGMRLIDFLREELKLKGTKEGCSCGECGACTVILDGKAVNSCLIYVKAVDKSSILTIEGLSREELHPIQRAFIEEGAVQCGFCIPGMIMSAKALLDHNINASEEEIRRGISGNLCRCTGYEKIVKGIIRAQKYLKGE